MFSPSMSILHPAGGQENKVNERPTDSYDILTEEILACIFSLLGRNSNYSLVCKRWRAIAASQDYRLPLFQALKKAQYIMSDTHDVISIDKTLSIKNAKTQIIRISDRRILFVNSESANLIEFSLERKTFYETKIDRRDDSEQYLWRFVGCQYKKISFFLVNKEDKSLSGLSIYNLDGSSKHAFISFDDFPTKIYLTDVKYYFPIYKDLSLLITNNEILKIKLIDGQSVLEGSLNFSQLPPFACYSRISPSQHPYNIQLNLIQNHLLLQHLSSLFMIDLEEFIPIRMTTYNQNIFMSKPIDSRGYVRQLQRNPATFFIKNGQFHALKANDTQTEISYYRLNQKYHWELMKQEKLKTPFRNSKIERKLMGKDSYVFINFATGIESEPILSIARTYQYSKNFFCSSLVHCVKSF